MSDTNRSIEDLLLSTLDAVSRFRIGRLEAVTAALDAGSLLTEAKGRLPHGEWGDWLVRVKLSPRTASTWIRLAALDITLGLPRCQGTSPRGFVCLPDVERPRFSPQLSNTSQ